ncbi:L-threonylcarbamoyladenylate synthase [Fluoribacter dumoffii]|uniref:Threonylcarbamoyl-AMP synthase n=1 Tax=Fluoribacter dumoffii TaxID=463 RepID=A0A377GFL6_9GAMM|nr:L-threonylcarbamoyladenylate synthase [Fluoribacter dumoffii]KTC91454.1 translation initiation protein [Fluoribacter dumoffii NY 23]MCW8460831.1 L-threonylcarbamoyladenylate synthase [Fluoribacter dumoffii]MCW8484273.1 L-threonylcarbamoyladenylate synthase [Fluoribacter dumoffii]MCW8497628.1 L-threonylcarbamoyladenylate synthase [Fluoribacter dumoffii]STO23158.1 t(6)A37 threonylcarbamoyladenosine biosynthesis protein RimN [Fluoribacter dumoffii]
MPLITTHIDRAIHDLQEGKPVAIPTETVYGLAAPVNNEKAIRAVFAMKNRPLNHPLIVHVAKNWDLTQWVKDIPEYAQQLIEKFWPGPLTLVFHCKVDQINPLITGGQTTVAVRCPAHPLTQELLMKLGTPLVAPSANPFGKVSPTTAQHVSESFPDQELTILDGGRCTVGIESTILDATHAKNYQILRHGLIDEKTIAEVITTPSLHQENTLRVPGKLESHYQPQKTLYYFSDYEALSNFCRNNPDKIYAIASKQPPGVLEEHFHLLGNKPEQVAFDLYYQLRKADTSDVQTIVIELPPATESWQGIRERILKAGITYSS